MNKSMIIEIPYGGMGDHLFHSHLPRIAKETGLYDNVLISTKSIFRHENNKKLIWELNPYIDGFTEEPGIKCNIATLVHKVSRDWKQGNSQNNLLDEIMTAFGLEDGKRYHEPEVFYKPQYISEYNKRIFDPNFFSDVGAMNKTDLNYFLKKHKYSFDAVMTQISPKALYQYNNDTIYFSTQELTTFCDLIYSCEELLCLTSGTATLAAALKKPSTVFFGAGQPTGYQHSKLHKYVFIPLCPKTKFLNVIKYPYRLIRYQRPKINKM